MNILASDQLIIFIVAYNKQNQPPNRKAIPLFVSLLKKTRNNSPPNSSPQYKQYIIPSNSDSMWCRAYQTRLFDDSWLVGRDKYEVAINTIICCCQSKLQQFSFFIFLFFSNTQSFEQNNLLRIWRLFYSLVVSCFLFIFSLEKFNRESVLLQLNE